MAGYYGLPVTLFLEQEGERCFLHLFDCHGLPLGRARERKLEGAVLRGEQTRVPAARVGCVEQVSGTTSAYAADAARRARVTRAPLRPLTVAVTGQTPADRAMAEALEKLGCTVTENRAEGTPALCADHGGFRLLGWDETGELIGHERMLTIAALIEYEDGEGRVAVPPAAPAAIETLAAGYGGGALRLGRDGREADERYQALPWLRDAVFAACRIYSRMGMTGETLKALDSRAPRFHLNTREVPLKGNRGELMQRLAKSIPDAVPAGEGLRLQTGEGWVYLAPLTRRSALRVVGEGPDTEIAQELCDFYVQRAGELDRELGERNPDTKLS